jgi:hypothetical protein
MLGICCKLKLRNTILPTHSSNNVCLSTLDFKPRFVYKELFYARPIILLLLPLVITFLPPLPFSLLHDVERTNEQTNERTVTLLFSRHVHLLLTITTFFAFCIVPLSFGTRSATTMTKTIRTTTMLMTTPPLLHVAQKGSFQNFQL